MKRTLYILVAGAILLPVPTSGEGIETVDIDPTVWQGFRKLGQFTLVFLDGFQIKEGGSFEDRVVLEFDMTLFPRPFETAKVVLWFDNFNEGGPVGVVDLFDYEGNGIADETDFDAGTVPYTCFEHNEDPPWKVFVDLAGAFEQAIDDDVPFLGFRLSTETEDTFVLASSAGMRAPILQVKSRVFEHDDYVLFAACVSGPDTAATTECLSYDFDDDADVDVSDFQVFQRFFRGVIEPPPRPTNCCETDHGPGCDQPEVEECVCELMTSCCSTDWDAFCVGFAENHFCLFCPEE